MNNNKNHNKNDQRNNPTCSIIFQERVRNQLHYRTEAQAQAHYILCITYRRQLHYLAMARYSKFKMREKLYHVYTILYLY
jgi:hypothetical protein